MNHEPIQQNSALKRCKEALLGYDIRFHLERAMELDKIVGESWFQDISTLETVEDAVQWLNREYSHMWYQQLLVHARKKERFTLEITFACLIKYIAFNLLINSLHNDIRRIHPDFAERLKNAQKDVTGAIEKGSFETAKGQVRTYVEQRKAGIQRISALMRDGGTEHPKVKIFNAGIPGSGKRR